MLRLGFPRLTAFGGVAVGQARPPLPRLVVMLRLGFPRLTAFGGVAVG